MRYDARARKPHRAATVCGPLSREGRTRTPGRAMVQRAPARWRLPPSPDGIGAAATAEGWRGDRDVTCIK
eukprot:5955728-Alexandrium_andersonii.AAC.1